MKIILVLLNILCYTIPCNLKNSVKNAERINKMDNFVEQLVAKKADGKAYFLRVLIALFAALMVALGIVATVMFAFPLLLLVSVGACYLAWWLFGSTSIEYEYIVTNNDFDVDKIIGKRSRKRLISVQLDKATEFGEYTSDRIGQGADATVMAADGTGGNVWYLLINSDDYGKLLILFTPTAETLECINHGVPYTVKIKLPEKTEE